MQGGRYALQVRVWTGGVCGTFIRCRRQQKAEQVYGVQGRVRRETRESYFGVKSLHHAEVMQGGRKGSRWRRRKHE